MAHEGRAHKFQSLKGVRCHIFIYLMVFDLRCCVGWHVYTFNMFNFLVGMFLRFAVVVCLMSAALEINKHTTAISEKA